MDPEEIARQLEQKYGRDGAIQQLSGSQDALDRQVLAALQAKPGVMGTLADVGRQVGSGLGEVLPKFMQGAANLGGAAIPGNDPLQRFGGALGGLMDQRRAETAPQTGLGGVARLASRVGGEIGLGVATAGASRVAGAGRLGMLGADALAGGTIAAAGPEDSALSLVSDDLAQSPVARFLGDTALVGAGDAIFRGVKALRGRGAVDEIIEDASKRTHLRMAADEIESQIPKAEGGAKKILQEGLDEAQEALSDVLPEVTVADEVVDEAGNLVRGAKVFYGDTMVGNVGWAAGGPRAANPELFDEVVDSYRRLIGQHGIEGLKKPQGWDAQEALAKELFVTGKYGESLAKLPGDMDVADVFVVTALVNKRADAMQDLSRKIADTTLDPAARQAATEQYARVGRQLDDVVFKRFVNGSETARRLAAYRNIAMRIDDPATALAEAQRAFARGRGLMPLPPEVSEKVLVLAREGKKRELVDYISNLHKSTKWEQLTTLWKAGLLTNLTTQMANTLGNRTMDALETLKDIPGSAVDRVVSAALGTPRTRTFSLGHMARGASDPQTLDNIMEIGQKLEVPRRVSFSNLSTEQTVFDKLKVNWLLDKYVGGVFGLLEVTDRKFIGDALERSLRQQADVLVKNAGLSGNDAKQRVLALLKNPSDEMALEAISEVHLQAARATAKEDALLATFRNQGRAADAAGLMKRAVNKFGVGEFIMPFTRTPANIGARVIESSPLGLLQGVGELTFRGAMKIAAGKDLPIATQRALVDRIGRGASGSSIVALGWLMWDRGVLTGPLPEAQGERDMFFQSGKQPNSIKVGDTWVGLERLSPLGNLLVLGASLAEQIVGTKDVDLTGAAVGSLASIGSTLTEQPFLTGVQRSLESLERPGEAGGRQLETFAGSFVPNIARSIARGVDPTIREQQGVGDALRAAVPGMSSDLPARIQPLGDEARRDKGVLGQLFIPAQLSEDQRRDRIIGTLDSLGVSITRRSFERSGQAGESREGFERRARQEGQELRSRIEQVVSRPSFQRKDKDEQRDAIESLVQTLRNKQTKRAKREVARR